MKIVYRRGFYFITDVGQSVAATDTETGETILIPRYGLWQGRTRAEVIQASNDLSVLQLQADKLNDPAHCEVCRAIGRICTIHAKA